MTHEYDVEIQNDFLERQTRAQPVDAVAELVWNALDADATSVSVEFDNDKLGAIQKIVVSDDGTGIPFDEAPALFKKLGGSWKKTGARTKKYDRVLHGQEGRGRFKAFALGSVVDWKVVYEKVKGDLYTYEITIIDRDIRKVRITDEKKIKGAKTGVTVVVSELKRNFTSLHSDSSLQEFSEILALYLKNYSNVSVSIAGERIDPQKAIEDARVIDLTPIVDEDGKTYPVSLEIIEWRRPTKRALYLCDYGGFPLSQVETRFHVGSFLFSAYLKSAYMRELHQDNRLELAEMLPAVTAAIDEARKRIKEAFRDKAAERAKSVVQDWIEKKVYPYEGQAATQIESAERKIFDIVAVTVQEAAPDFNEIPNQQMALHLRMLRHAIERSPTELQRILDEVLKLPKRKQQELAPFLMKQICRASSARPV